MLRTKLFEIIKSNLFFFFFLVVIAFLLYGKSLSYDYTNHDDSSLIQDKNLLLSDAKNIPKLFTTSCFYSGNFQYYRPILTLSFAIETILFGENIFIYHLTNLFLFILSLWLMYVFLCKLNLNKVILQFLIILVSVHPIITSCAVWIPARNDTLLIIFLMSSFIFFIKYLNNKKNIFIVLSLFLFVLALFTKEITLVSIFIYGYLLFFFNVKLNKKNIILFITIILLSICLFFYLKSISTIGLDLNHYISNFKEYLVNIIVWTSVYIKQILCPYNMPVMLYKTVFNSNYFALFVICIILPLYLAFKNILDKKLIFFGFIFFFVFLLPTFFLYDCLLLFHRIFLPLVGIIVIICEVLDKFLTKFKTLKKYFVYFFICLIVILFYKSSIQADKYINAYIYWDNAYKNAPNYHVACLFKSYIEFESGNFEKSEELIKEAMKYDAKLYYANMAVLLFEQKKYKEAESLFLESIKNNIDVATSYYYLSKIYLALSDIEKAKNFALVAYELNPYNKSVNKLKDQFN